MDCTRLDVFTPNMCSLSFYPKILLLKFPVLQLSAHRAALMNITAGSDEGSELLHCSDWKICRFTFKAFGMP